MAHASKDPSSGEQVTVVKHNADGSTTTIQVDEDALNELSGNLVVIQSDLSETRDLVTNGNLTRIKSMTFHLMPDFQFEQVDALNLKLGGFDDALELQEAYRENFYKGKAEQIERINHGYATGEQVSRDITQAYLDEDGNVSADVTTVGSEFESGNSISQADFDENVDEYGNPTA